MARLFFSVISVLLFRDVIADDFDGIRKVCEPIVLHQTLKNTKFDVKNELWRHYISRMYFSSANSIETAKIDGFKLEAVVDNTPLSAIWSRDQKKRSEARAVWKKYVDENVVRKDATSFSEVKNNPEALSEYNKCIQILAMRARDPLVCYWSAPEGSRTNATFYVLFRPDFELKRPKVKLNQILNGFVIPDGDSISRLGYRKATQVRKELDELDARANLPGVPQWAKTSLQFPQNTVGMAHISLNCAA